MRFPVMRDKNIFTSGKIIKNYLELTDFYKVTTH